MPSHTNPKVSLGASIPVASSRFQSVIRHFPELGILPKVMEMEGCIVGNLREDEVDLFKNALGNYAQIFELVAEEAVFRLSRLLINTTLLPGNDLEQFFLGQQYRQRKSTQCIVAF